MLALQDKDHICRATVPALAKICNITNELCEEYLTDFQQPDKYSRSQEHEGRRIEQIEGGYRILNGEYYQQLLARKIVGNTSETRHRNTETKRGQT